MLASISSSPRRLKNFFNRSSPLRSPRTQTPLRQDGVSNGNSPSLPLDLQLNIIDILLLDELRKGLDPAGDASEYSDPKSFAWEAYRIALTCRAFEKHVRAFLQRERGMSRTQEQKGMGS